MRYQSHDLDGFITYSQLYGNGDSAFTQFLPAKAQTGQVSRSDIQVVHQDVTGWRKSTDYVVNDSRVVFEEGYRSLSSSNRNPSVITDGDTREVWEGPCYWIPSFQPSVDWEFPVIPDDTYGKLVNKNLLKLRDQKINLALNMAELSKTAEGVAQFATKLLKSYRSFRRGDFKGSLSAMGLSTRRRGKDASSTWLELQYGILPLAADIRGGYDEIRRETRNHGQRTRTTSRFSTSGGVKESGIATEFQGFTGSLSFDITATAQLVLWYEVDNPMLLAASSVGLTNLAEVAWELTPWSFVLDWVLPVGDYLGALTASQGFKFLGGSYSTVTQQHNQRWLEPTGPFVNGQDQWILVTPSCSGRRITYAKDFNRVSLSQFDAPRAFLPSFKSPVSVGHALNALALLRGRT